ncbi:hypothetical protein ADUPG1_010329, partial [Aduncisulcus paluster]
MVTQVFFDMNIDDKPVGRIVFDLFSSKCPKTCENFRLLCTGEASRIPGIGKPLSLKGSSIFKIIPYFCMQGGDITSTEGMEGSGGYSAIDGRTFADESFDVAYDAPYTLGMSNCGKNTNGSQFFVTFDACSWLQGKYVAFGIVHSGKDVLKQIEAVGRLSGKPRSKVVIA